MWPFIKREYRGINESIAKGTKLQKYIKARAIRWSVVKIWKDFALIWKDKAGLDKNKFSVCERKWQRDDTSCHRQAEGTKDTGI